MSGRFGTFFAGVVVGALLVFGSLKFHVLRTNDGVAVVPKLQPSFAEVYVDIREFGPTDWASHGSLVAAIVHAKKDQLLGDSAMDGMRGKVNSFLDSMQNMAEGAL